MSFQGRDNNISSDPTFFSRIKAYKLQMEINLGANAFEKLRYSFPELSLPSLKVLRNEMQGLSGVETALYDCCANSCMCFTGAHADLVECHYCGTNRYRKDGVTPVKQFQYVPFLPQIKAMYAGRESAAAMRYRSDHEDDNIHDAHGTISDIYGSELYQQLRTQPVVVDNHILPYNYFSDPRDVLLISLTDGFQLFKRGKHTAWPLLFINANLNPKTG